jgi:hypothetical protein
MKKQLKKRIESTQKSLELYATCVCTCGGCAGCGSVPANDYVNVFDNRGWNNNYSDYVRRNAI